MKTFTKVICLCMAFAFALLTTVPTFSQAGVLNPNDPIVVYNPSAPPATPPLGTMVKWVKKNRLAWNTESFKAYYYDGMQFRLKFPKTYQHGVNDGKKYPVYIFLHGLGEKSTDVYDNEYHLVHGGQVHMNAVDNGTFDGFLLYPQNTNQDFFSTGDIDLIKRIVELYLVPQVKADINRVYLDGLSAGGTGVWTFLNRHPTFAAAATPISAGSPNYGAYANALRFTPIWHFQGMLDNSPSPAVGRQIETAFLAAGADYRLKLFPGLGHGCWNAAWALPDYFPFMLRANKLNPYAIGGRTEFCEGIPFSTTIGITAGFSGYQWRRNGNSLPNTTNQITISQTGIYEVRVLRNGVWSEWSPTPLEIKYKETTVPPVITTAGTSLVIPSPADAGARLEVPDNYVSYRWYRVGTTDTVSSERSVYVTTPGQYSVRVMEQYGCAPAFAAPVTVVDVNNGTNIPDAPTKPILTPLSNSSVKLDWTDNPSATYNETGFEVYRSKLLNGPYELIGTTAADVLTYTVTGLNYNDKFYFKLRAFNGTGASAVSLPAYGGPEAEKTAPTAPGNLTITATASTSVSLRWNKATDNIGVIRYDIFLNGLKQHFTTDTTFTVFNLTSGKNYAIVVKAVDAAGNISVASNQVSINNGGSTTIPNGINRKQYYPSSGTWTSLPNFSTQTVRSQSVVANLSFSGVSRTTNMGLLYEGFIYIPVSGSYTFRLNSDDGSRLWLSTYNANATPLVNNNGNFGSPTAAEGTTTLNEGFYPISIAYFKNSGTRVLDLTWRTPQTNGGFVAVPDYLLFTQTTLPSLPAPVAPSGLVATPVSYTKVNLNWTDNSSNETGFEVYRSTSPSEGFAIIGTVKQPSFVDSTLTAGTTYYYKVRAINNTSVSKFDNDGPGVSFDYYELNNMTFVPAFPALLPIKSGSAANFDLSVRNRDDNFAINFYGTITIPTTGTYTFYTTSDDGSRLLIGGTAASNLVVNNDALHGAQEASGTITLNEGTYPIYVQFFEAGGDQLLNVSWSGPGIAKDLIPSSALGKPLASATTTSLPALPAVPTGLLASGVNQSTIQLSWTDAANNESAYEVWRSSVNNTNYVKIASLPANTTSYTNTGLFGQSVFYYKVKAVNAGGDNGFSNEDSATTGNNAPVITTIADQYIRFDATSILKIKATDIGSGDIVITTSGVPAFAQFNAGSNDGNATLTFTPSAADLNTSGSITVRAADASSYSEQTFQWFVNDNYKPVLAAVSSVTVNEKATAQINLSANDQDGSTYNWSFVNLPSFATFTPNGSTVQVQVAPGYADNGDYFVTARVDDGQNGFDTATFKISVVNVQPYSKILVDFNDATVTSPAPWNNTNKAPAANDNFPALKDAEGNTTTVGLTVTTPWQNVNPRASNTGSTTGNNSGIYPDDVIRSIWFTNTAKQTIRISGLDPAKVYHFSLMGSRAAPQVAVVSTYTIAGQSVTLNAANNTQNVARISNVTPAADGTVLLDLQPQAGSSFAYLGSLVIEWAYEDGTPPAQPKNLNAQLINGKSILNWQDAAYNETAYEVWRSTSETGDYTQLNVTAPSFDLQQYTDSLLSGNTTYYYKVRATNSVGNSPFSNIVSVAIPNTKPVLSNIATIEIKTDDIIDIPISTIDDASDVITFTSAGLPSFATLIDNGNGTGIIRLVPGKTVGTFMNASVTAQDQDGASDTKKFKIIVRDKTKTYVYVNFAAAPLAPLPWNNVTGLPNAGLTLTDLKDNTNASTGMSVTVMDDWNGFSNTGATTGDNSGVYPDDVMKTFYYKIAADTMRVKLSGLQSNRKYDLAFFASRANYATDLVTRYIVGTQVVSLLVNDNTANTVSINGISPDANGEIIVRVVKQANSAFAYLGAMEVNSYPYDGTPAAPVNLIADSYSKTQIRLRWQSGQTGVSSYQVWRSTSLNGTYSQVTSVSGTTTSYIDGSRSQNVMYYYKVRAVANGINSAYSNTASAYTISYNINLNLNDGGNTGSSPWNNTNALMQSPFTLPNLQNDASQRTGINFNLTRDFSGYNTLGVYQNGLYPRNVNRSFFYTNYGDTAHIRINNLNATHLYTFIFFGSRANPAAGVGVTTKYIIGEQAVTLDAANNLNNVATIYNVKPDETGGINIVVHSALVNGYGYLNAMQIQGTLNPEFYVDGMEIQPEDPQQQNVVQQRAAAVQEGGNDEAVSDTATTTVAPAMARTATASENQQETYKGKTEVSAYPNPFSNDVTLRLDLKKNIDKFTIVLMDMTGKVILRKEVSRLSAGIWQQQLGLERMSLKSGIYIISVQGIPDEKPATFRIIKRQ